MTALSWFANACIQAGTGSTGVGAPGGGPRLLIRHGAIEVRAPQGMMQDSRDICLRVDTARMWRDKVGWAGTALGRRECIHLVGRDETAEVEVALSPVSNFEEVWAALRRAGIDAVSSE